MEPNLIEALKLSAAGMLIVFSSLIIIALVISVMRSLDEKYTKAQERKNAPAPVKQQTLDNLTLVLISAATATVLQNKQYRMRSIRKIVSRDATVAGWAMEGRSVLHGSHVMNVKTEK
ncbi:MAG: hypothetical protein C0603_04115 [Denitrovibrio sp.]|nr:MAG: hypothetical protein C0603_04115 [Denitrovibrio sp.]